MRIVDNIDNGNVALDNINNISQNTYGSLSGNPSVDYRHANNIDTTRFVSNDFIDSENCNTENIYELKSESEICNRQYSLNNNANLTTSLKVTNLDKVRQTKTKWQDAVVAPKYSSNAPLGEERGFDNSDSDEMSENSVQHVPRGIVNPNYPGFQHLAHTLQDYSSNIEQFYQSENDMTDDDLDIESTPEKTFDINEKIEEKYINNNNENDSSVSNNPFTNDSLKQSSNTQNDIPDLLKTVTFNNNNVDSVQYEFTCSTTDIENNFRAKDIIGDFNKEVEDEIRQLLNYNINIEDDLEELRRDIKDTFAKPIENTLNNISDVVNHVIKKLVESDECDRSDASTPDIIIDHEMEDISNMNRENETNSRTELSISRPTFLLIESNKNVTIRDALLSDGKDEINVDEYDTEHLSINVENTIKQLSTELRKIIPKLNEMRERDKLWIDNKKETQVVTDGNSNTVVQNPSASTCDASSQNSSSSIGRKIHNISTINQRSIRSHIESKLRPNAKKTLPKGPKNLSVRKNENHNESDLESFDVYNIETALPKLDLDAIESHIRAAKEAERRKRNDREEIRKRLAMGGDTEDYYSLGHTDRPGKKPSLHSRLQNGKNLQICFMNETASDNESQASDLEHSFNCNSKSSSRSSIFSKNSYNHPYQTRPLSVNITKHEKSNPPSGAKLRPTSLMLKTSKSRSTHSLGHIELKESDFYALQATLQTEARIALAQAKEMARIQMERERRSRPVSPVTEMLRRSMEKASAPLAADRRRVSRHLLTDMNIAQLQVIVNELHSQIESLNDTLVKLLMARDELHMGQDSMLVDIEDLTRYLGVREQTKKTKGNQKSGVKRFTSLVHK